MKKILIFTAILFLFPTSVFAASIDDGYDTRLITPKSSYQKVQDQQQKTAEAILNLFNTEVEYVEPTTIPSAVPPQNASPTSSIQPTAPYATLPPGNGQSSAGCPPEATRISVRETQYRHLNRYLPCDAPRMIVIHWSGAWSSAQATFNVLNDRDRSCQFAIDSNSSLQMLNLYEYSVERGWCAGGNANVGSFNFEITGAWFDDVLELGRGKQYDELMISTSKAVDISCQLIKRHSIRKTEIYGHYQLQTGKSDPGPKYLQFFKNELAKKCT